MYDSQGFNGTFRIQNQVLGCKVSGDCRKKKGLVQRKFQRSGWASCRSVSLVQDLFHARSVSAQNDFM